MSTLEGKTMNIVLNIASIFIKNKYLDELFIAEYIALDILTKKNIQSKILRNKVTDSLYIRVIKNNYDYYITDYLNEQIINKGEQYFIEDGKKWDGDWESLPDKLKSIVYECYYIHEIASPVININKEDLRRIISRKYSPILDILSNREIL